MFETLSHITRYSALCIIASSKFQYVAHDHDHYAPHHRHYSSTLSRHITCCYPRSKRPRATDSEVSHETLLACRA